jgi:predicted protein tyrosine phosphatase
MNAWVLLAAAVGLFLIVVLLIGMRRPRTIQAELDRPQRPASAKQRPALLESSGSLAQTSLRTLLLSMQARRATGTLTVTSNDQTCSLHLLFGHLFHASCGEVEGEQAVQTALSWADGSYAFDPKARLPTAETIERPTDQVLADSVGVATPVTSPPSPESVDWTALLSHMQQLADAALQDRSRKVNEILAATQPNRASFLETIDRIANTSIMFVDPARLNTLAGQLRRVLDEATG